VPSSPYIFLANNMPFSKIEHIYSKSNCTRIDRSGILLHTLLNAPFTEISAMGNPKLVLSYLSQKRGLKSLCLVLLEGCCAGDTIVSEFF
jgi:hypothetical protein